MTALKWLAVAAVVGYVGLAALMYFFQRNLMYFPDATRTTPAAAGLPQAREVTIESADGERLIVWHVAPQPGRPLVLYFQGNGGALNLRADRFRKIVASGAGLVALSYRGYGGSTGRPSEQGLLLDAKAAYAFAAAQVPTERIVIFGESLGTAVAVATAAEQPSAGLILDAPFISALEVAAASFPFVPVRWLMKDAFRSDLRIVNVHVPLLVLHGELDTIIRIGFGEKLFALAHEPKRFVRFPEGAHVNLDSYGAMNSILPFLDSVVAKP
ncbi:MAG: alpha/beta hydrolase [Pseudolabrys sp.]|nr:alpha/beta hydrolase [Pseudolabrys sp.]